MNCGLKLGKTSVPIDPLLFSNSFPSLNTPKDLENYFEYELAPFPLSLFEAADMRTTKRSNFYQIFRLITKKLDEQNTVFVVNGRFLLYRAEWRHCETFGAVRSRYVTYVEKHFNSNVVIVFDGYNGTVVHRKVATHHRTFLRNTSTDVHFNDGTTATIGRKHLCLTETGVI